MYKTEKCRGAEISRRARDTEETAEEEFRVGRGQGSGQVVQQESSNSDISTELRDPKYGRSTQPERLWSQIMEWKEIILNM